MDMKHPQMSKFAEKPRLHISWWTMGIGLSALISIPLVILFGLSTGPLPIERHGAFNWYGVTWGSIFLLLIALTLAGIITGAIALHRGERSWVVWLGWVPSVLLGIFWLFMLIGTLVFA